MAAKLIDTSVLAQPACGPKDKRIQGRVGDWTVTITPGHRSGRKPGVAEAHFRHPSGRYQAVGLGGKDLCATLVSEECVEVELPGGVVKRFYSPATYGQERQLLTNPSGSPMIAVQYERHFPSVEEGRDLALGLEDFPVEHNRHIDNLRDLALLVDCNEWDVSSAVGMVRSFQTANQGTVDAVSECAATWLIDHIVRGYVLHFNSMSPESFIAWDAADKWAEAQGYGCWSDLYYLVQKDDFQHKKSEEEAAAEAHAKFAGCPEYLTHRKEIDSADDRCIDRLLRACGEEAMAKVRRECPEMHERVRRDGFKELFPNRNWKREGNL